MNPKNKVNIKWNDKTIEANEGDNLLKTALDAGIDVGHYCYHSGLSVAGVCRMCMVEEDGNPRLFPSCNATVKNGMKITNTSEKVKEAAKWNLQYHLINHPLDCPVCDQAGECGLQDNYMELGLYDSSMTDAKVHKPKVQDIGRGVMLDAERCILCTRCTRFTDEVTGSYELGIVNRGDRSELISHEPLKNNYAQNLVDICPVGALTSSSFRFQQRVWLLDEVGTTCIGCETGCSITVSQNKTGSYRVRPRFDEKVNGHWMCDEGRGIYEHVSSPYRLQSCMKKEDDLFLPIKLEKLQEELSDREHKFILNSYFTNEELEEFFNVERKSTDVSLMNFPDQGEAFDGILLRSQKNPNYLGTVNKFQKLNIDDSQSGLDSFLTDLNSTNDIIFLAIPEIIVDEDYFLTLIEKIPKHITKVAFSSSEKFPNAKEFDYLLPIPTFLEKNGTYLNYSSERRALKKGLSYGESQYEIGFYSKLLQGWRK
jgi:NADH-quinone oxidoreductase subunit G